MTADPWALLREARVFVGFCPTTQEGIDRVCEVRDRIDAALAERQDSATGFVESEVEWNNHNAQFSTAYPDDETSLTVSRFDMTRQEWRWDMEREIKRKGYCDTLNDAKTAAIAAARRMK
jgi:hypothetical protein